MTWVADRDADHALSWKRCRSGSIPWRYGDRAGLSEGIKDKLLARNLFRKKISLFQSIRKPDHQIRALVQDGDDQRWLIRSWETKEIMMFASRHAQGRGEFAQFLELSPARRKIRKAAVQLRHIGANLFFAPLLPGVADDLTDVGFSRRRQDIVVGQARLFPPSSSSMISVTLLEETLPAKPSDTLFSSMDFSSCHA